MSKEWYYSYMMESVCPKCHGARLSKEVLSVKVGGKNIYEFTQMSIIDAYEFIRKLELDKSRQTIADMLIN